MIFDQVVIDPALVLPYWKCFEVPQQLGARAQLYHAGIQVGIAGGALRDARWFLTEKARPFFEATRTGWTESAAGDPHVIHRFGELATRVRAAETLLSDAAEVLDSVGRVPADAHEAARGSIAVAQAKAFASEVAVSVASDLFSLSGASAADEKYDLSRHWRNARTHASHDPVDWKYHHVGNYLLSGVLPPNHASYDDGGDPLAAGARRADRAHDAPASGQRHVQSDRAAAFGRNDRSSPRLGD